MELGIMAGLFALLVGYAAGRVSLDGVRGEERAACQNRVMSRALERGAEGDEAEVWLRAARACNPDSRWDSEPEEDDE